jgi:hypothetical protein
MRQSLLRAPEDVDSIAADSGNPLSSATFKRGMIAHENHGEIAGHEAEAAKYSPEYASIFIPPWPNAG